MSYTSGAGVFLYIEGEKLLKCSEMQSNKQSDEHTVAISTLAETEVKLKHLLLHVSIFCVFLDLGEEIRR